MSSIDTIRDVSIILVDDDESIRRSLEFCFRRKKIPFRSFETAEEALKHIRNLEAASIVISDYRLPGLNGLQLFEELNGIDPSLWKILITAHGNLDVAVEAMRLGVHDFIQKPFNSRTIEMAIHALIKRMKHDSNGIFVDGRSLNESDNLLWRERMELAVARSSHTMNNLLFAIMGNAEFGLRAADSGRAVHTSLERIAREARQASLFNNRLMSLCRESAEAVENIDVNEAVRECAARFQYVCKDSIEIVFTPTESPFIVEVVKTYLQDIIENLILNSIQELVTVRKPSKRIAIAVKNSPLERSVVVSDNGDGIEPAILEKLTRKGFTTKPAGHGLGLYIVGSLVEKIGASLDIRSKPGLGTDIGIIFLDKNR